VNSVELKITERKEEPLLSRVNLTGEIIFEAATPSYDEVKKKISSSLNCDEKLIVIKNIYAKFGIKKADFLAYIYNNEESMKKIEPKPKEKKKAQEEKPTEKTEHPKEEKEPQKEEKKKPKETKEEKKPKETSKEEKKPEEKKEKKQ